MEPRFCVSAARAWRRIHHLRSGISGIGVCLWGSCALKARLIARFAGYSLIASASQVD
jgi:hypothetical protein